MSRLIHFLSFILFFTSCHCSKVQLTGRTSHSPQRQQITYTSSRTRSNSNVSRARQTCLNNESKLNRKETFIFSVKNHGNWKLYDWTKVTTIVLAGYVDEELIKYAHSKNAKVSFTADFPGKQLTNATARTEWVSSQVNYMKVHSLDGVNVDFEQAISHKEQDYRQGLTLLVKELVFAVRNNFKCSQVTFDVAWSPDCIDERCYDYVAIAELVDFVFVMSYDERSQISGACIAWANSPYNTTLAGLKRYLDLGIAAEKLVLGVPWYGYDYPCISYSQESNVCHLKKVPFRGAPCSDAAGKERGYTDILLNSLPLSTTGRLWDNTARSPYFTYKASTGQLHQVWYDDPYSLTYKYGIARKLDLRGVGMWNADSLDYSDKPAARLEVKAMWAALPEW